MKVAPEPVLSDVVRQRLELLLAEVRPRHALTGAEDPDAPEPAGAPAAAQPGPGDDRWEGRRERGEPAAAVATALGPPPREPARRLLRAPGGPVAEAGRRALEFTRDHLAAVVLVLLVGCGWTAYSLLQARSVSVAVAAPPAVVASPVPTPSATPALLVHIIGAVRRPGVVELSQGSRVADAIDAAGGLTRAADPAELNLAAVVADGSQIVIGSREEPRGELRGSEGGTSAGGATGAGTVSLNTATLEQLDTLPGVGPVTAQKILDWRTKHGRFTSVGELQEVDGIGPKTYADIAPNVRV